jgi:ABC-type branched-subunit amino acid transport system substrate-binding protein/cytochrome c553
MRMPRAGLYAAALCAATLSFHAPAAGDDRLELGRRIYLEGRNLRGEDIRALLGGGNTALAGAAVACGNCHGADGRGRPEGGVVPPDITWAELTKPYGHVRSGGRRHGPFDERSFARAVTEGIDPAGQRIDGAMPRYSMAGSELAALTDYLKQLAQQRDPGITDSAVRLGTIVPDKGPAAETGTVIRAMLRAFIGDINEHGGIHGRRLELVVAADVADAQQRFAAQPVFALVSPYGIGHEQALAQWAAAQRVAVVAPFTLSTDADPPPQWFYLYAGEAELARVLIDYAARQGDLSTQRLAAFVGAPDGRVAQALRSECERRRCGGLEVLPSGATADPGVVSRLMHMGVQSVVFAGGERELAQLLGYADRLGWRPPVYAASAAAARAMYQAPAAFDGRLFVAYPTRGELQTRSAAAAEFDRLRASRSLGTTHAAAQGFAYAAAAIAAEGLRQAGRDLSRERFARALESLHRFDAGPTPPVSYGPGRRVGAFGGYVVAVDPGRGFRPVSDWIALEPL